MYKFQGYGIVWDTENHKPLMKFVNGEYETADNTIANKLIAAKYEPIEVPVSDKGPKPIEKMTVPELKEYAAENGIDLGDATKKDDIAALILATVNGHGN